jgi:hypothetical protein
MNKKMTAREIVAQIAPFIQIEETMLALLGGGGLYDPNTRTIHLTDLEATDGFSLAVAAHEAFHAVRHMRGVAIYSKPYPEWTTRATHREEAAVNREAKAFLLPLMAGDRKALRDARRFFHKSALSYSCLGVALRFLGVVRFLVSIQIRSKIAMWQLSREDRRTLDQEKNWDINELIAEMRAELAATATE